MLIGFVGKPNAGKSSLFSAATLTDTQIANYPFTTIDPNKGVTYVRAPCPHVEMKKKCNPKNSLCESGARLIPINALDVAGLVPGAHEGKGLGNQFMSDLNQADALIHVVDISGTTDLEGKPCDECDPAEEVLFLEKEITHWIAGIMNRNWAKVRGKNISGLADVFASLKLNEKDAEKIADNLSLKKERIDWNEEQILSFADEARKLTKPVLIAANKSDLPAAKENLEKLKQKFPGKIIISTCAPAEIALRKAKEKGAIDYTPGDADFKITGELDEKQKQGLEKIRKILNENEFGTGVQKAINETVFSLLNLIIVYPVEDESKLTNNFGEVLPDAFLVKKGTTAVEFAGRIHTDLAKNFITAVNAKTKMKVGKGYIINNNDILKIVAGK